jgi:hypothetical protein
MNVALGIVCAVLGHRWAPAEDVHETYAVLRCRRCRAELEVTGEDRRLVAWTGRSRTPQGRMSGGGTGPDGRPW